MVIVLCHVGLPLWISARDVARSRFLRFPSPFSPVDIAFEHLYLKILQATWHKYVPFDDV